MVGEMQEAREIFEVAIAIGRDTSIDPDEFLELQRVIADKRARLS